MRRFLISLCLCLALLLPLTTYAKLTGEVVFRHPEKDFNELWISDVGDTRNARRMFKHTQDIYELAVQNDGPYVVFVAQHEEPFFQQDAYLLDRNEIPAKARDLTQKRFDTIWEIDISHAGDVAFTNYPTGNRVPEPPYGIYLIPREELKTGLPNAQLLHETDAIRVKWAPDGTQIAYDIAGGGIYVYNLLSRTIHGITQDGYFPAFSPGSKRLAFVHKFLGEGTAINIISLVHPRRRLKTIALGEHSAFIALKWAPDGQALVYTVYGPDNLYHNYVAPLDGGPHEEILTIAGQGVPMFDWTKSAYAVEPTNRLTTRWGQLKQRGSK